jgi:hypothetical protein
MCSDHGYLQTRKARRFVFEAARFLGNSGSPAVNCCLVLVLHG